MHRLLTILRYLIAATALLMCADPAYGRWL